MRKAVPETTIRFEAEECDDDAAYVELKLMEAVEPWPEHHEPKPQHGSHMLDSDGPWGAAARGVEIRQCANVKKGMGAFATRKLIAGGVLGVYFGELLTMRQHVLRHGWRLYQVAHKPTKAEQQEMCERESRLAALTSGQPSGGANNGSAYCFSLFPEALKDALGSTTLPRRIAYIDCEDPNRSTWCRYVNHAPAGDPACNAIPRCDPVSALVWLEATRDIEPGEELHFDYGDVYKWDAAPEREVGA